MNSLRTHMKLDGDRPESPFTFLSWSKTFCFVLLTSKIAPPFGQLLLASLEVHRLKKRTMTLWQMFHSLHYLLISCYLLWNKHRGSRKANRPPVKNTSICICHPLSHSITKPARWLRLREGIFHKRQSAAHKVESARLVNPSRIL